MVRARYAILLALIGAGQIVLAARAGWFGWLLVWSGASWLAIAAGYTFVGPRIFGKQANGRQIWYSRCLLWPYHAVNGLLWALQTRVSREETCHEIAPGIWLGRRCRMGELPQGVRTIVDLTAEFSVAQGVAGERCYHCLPTLDATAPGPSELSRFIQTIAECEKPVYIHCALGHGRSAVVAIAALVELGHASSLEEAERIARASRPGAKLNSLQRRALAEWSQYRRTG